jgi:hypothetical protein
MFATDDAVAAHSANAPAEGRGVCLGRVIVNVIAVNGRANLRRSAARFQLQLHDAVLSSLRLSIRAGLRH